MWRRAGAALASGVYRNQHESLLRLSSEASTIPGATIVNKTIGDPVWRAGGFELPSGRRGIATAPPLLGKAAPVDAAKEPGNVVVDEFDKEARDGDVLAGSVECQVQKRKDGLYLYFKSLNIVPAYRRQAIGSMLVNTCLEVAQQKHKVVGAYFHVPTNDAGAISFCEKSGFSITDRIRNFYKEAANPDCYVLSRRSRAGVTFRPADVNQDLIEPAVVIAEFEKNVKAGVEEAGSIVCQVLRKADHWNHLYIKSLEVTVPYRRKTVGSQLMKHVLTYAEAKFGIVEAFLYVPTNDFQAMAFCEKCGFSIKDRLRNFYSGTESPDCYVYSKRLVKQV